MPNSIDNAWYLKKFSELSTDELYSILTLRVNVFMLEQNCLYPELDELDRHPETLHLFTKEKLFTDTKNNTSLSTNKVIAYSRILPMNTRYCDSVSIGRVVVNKAFRGTKLGHQLVAKSITVCQKCFANIPIKISAQAHLEKFYQQHNFKCITAPYLEDDIPHIGMQYIHP